MPWRKTASAIGLHTDVRGRWFTVVGSRRPGLSGHPLEAVWMVRWDDDGSTQELRVTGGFAAETETGEHGEAVNP